MCWNWLKNRTNSQWLALLFAAIFLGASIFFVCPSLNEWSIVNNELNQPREYNLTIGNIINIVAGEEQHNITWQIDLTIRQSHNILTTGDRVDISGIAYAETLPNFDIIDLSVWFQNSEPYYLTVDDNGMLNYNGSTVHLNTPVSNKLVGNASIKWGLEGTYRPIGQMLFKNETDTYNQLLGTSPDMAITVYPKSEYAQIVNSNVTMILAVAVYGLTLVGTGEFLLHLWDRKPLTDNGNEDSKNNKDTPTPEDNLTNKQEIREDDNGNSEI